MNCPHIVTHAEDGVFSITLNRPEKLNAITPAMHMALAAAFDRFAADAASRVCIVKAVAGRAFCAGSDLGAFSMNGSNPYPDTGYAGIAQRHDLTKPVIAAVDGICVGGGFELALACDMIVATERAVFGLPEPRVGLIAIGGGIHRLIREAGLKQAMGPLLTGRDMTAQEGLRLGFVSELVASDALDATLAALCDAIIANAPLAVQLTKELAMWGLDQPTLADALARQADHPSFRTWMQADDTREGPAAFAAKRKPEWQGK